MNYGQLKTLFFILLQNMACANCLMWDNLGVRGIIREQFQQLKDYFHHFFTVGLSRHRYGTENDDFFFFSRQLIEGHFTT